MKKYDPNDWEKSKKIVQKLIEQFGNEKAIAVLLMSIGNLTKHLAHNVTEKKFNEIMKDPIVSTGASISQEFMEAGDVLLKKYALRE